MGSGIVHIRKLPDCDEVNAQIIKQFKQYLNCDEARHSHYFAGRYENIYIDLLKVSAMQGVMDQAHHFAQEILNTSENLKRGFWFNLMRPGQVTQPHCHDDDDECLSAVYYIDTPENSGNLLLDLEAGVRSIKPTAGSFVFFPPELRHEVTENKSNFERLSVGINFGMEQTDPV